MSNTIRTCLLALLIGSPLVAFAGDPSGDDMRSLDGQVQEIKSDVLSIASELNTLEERLLFPSHTEVSVFVSLAEDEDFIAWLKTYPPNRMLATVCTGALLAGAAGRLSGRRATTHGAARTSRWGVSLRMRTDSPSPSP